MNKDTNFAPGTQMTSKAFIVLNIRCKAVKIRVGNLLEDSCEAKHSVTMWRSNCALCYENIKTTKNTHKTELLTMGKTWKEPL